MELLTYWKIVRKRLLLIIAIGAIAAGLAAYNVSQQVPLYSSTTTLFLNPAAANPLLPYQATRSMQATANTYIEFMRTRSFASIVAQESGLAVTPEQVRGALSSEYVPETQFFRITATLTDPAAAQRIAATAAESLIAENAARQQAEQAQIQSQRDLDPERQQLTQLRDTLREELNLFGQRIETTQEQIAAIEARLPSERNDERLGELRAELVDLQESRSQTLNSLASIQAALVGSNAANTTSSDTAVIVDEAPLPASAQPRNATRTILVWLVAGLALGVALAVGLEYLDYTVRSPEALEEVYRAPVQGVIGHLEGRRRAGSGPDPAYQLTFSEPRGAAAESIRSLRTSVQVAGLNHPIRSLVVTSAGPGEGKTFTATNLAVSMAQYGHTVILVDLDLRKPNLHSVFEIEREPGFTNLVLGREGELLSAARPQLQALATRLNGSAARFAASLENENVQLTMAVAQRLLREAESGPPELATIAADARRTIEQADDLNGFLRATAIPNLSVITAGTIPPHPSELLGSHRSAVVMSRLQEYADIVIFDTPPAGIVTDAVVVAPRVDAVIQVVRAGKTRIDLITRTKATLEQAGARLLGPVLNQVRHSDMGSYSYYYYYGYGEKGAKERRAK